MPVISFIRRTPPLVALPLATPYAELKGGRHLPRVAKFRITRAEYVAAQRLTLRGVLQRRQPYVRLALFSLLISVVVLWVMRDDVTSWSSRAGMMAGIAAYCFGLVGLIVGTNYVLLARRGGRLFDQHRSLADELSISWDTEALTIESPTSHARTDWSDYHRWREGRTLFLFYLNDQLYHLVPKRALNAADQIDLRACAARAIA